MTRDDGNSPLHRKNLCEAFVRLTTEDHLSGNQAARILGRSPAWFSRNVPLFLAGGVAALTTERRPLGSGRRLFKEGDEDLLPDWFLKAASFFYLLTNRTRDTGSMPEAIRLTISLPASCPNAVKARLLRKLELLELPTCPVVVRGMILAREKEGKPLLPQSLTRLITSPPSVVRQFRGPKAASLDFVQAPGSAMWLGGENGDREFIAPGVVVEADDATINFPCVVPWAMGGCACSEKFKVKVGRFQWLVAIDVGSRMVLGFTYTARPKSSYRAEDVLTLMRTVATAQGAPQHWRFEKGVWASNLVKNAARLMGSNRIEVHSPHAKPFIEGLFNKLWTKLSVHFPDSEVGRFRGDNEEASKLLTACQAGQKDPRRYFPPLAQVIAAFHQVIAEHNASIIRSDNYGEWVPEERWNQAKKHWPVVDTATESEHRFSPMRPLPVGAEWIFSPFVREWRVQGNCVGGKVPIMEKLSVPYQFSADFLHRYDGARVRVYFDPSAPQCVATLCLAEPWGNEREGDVLGEAEQSNETTQYVRMVLGWGNDDRSAGLRARRQAHASMRRETRAVAPGRNGHAFRESEERDGAGRITTISSTVPEETASQECASRRGVMSPTIGGETPAVSGDNSDGENSARPAPDGLAEIQRFEQTHPELFI